jgi:hypothetical protein
MKLFDGDVPPLGHDIVALLLPDGDHLLDAVLAQRLAILARVLVLGLSLFGHCCCLRCWVALYWLDVGVCVVPILVTAKSSFFVWCWKLVRVRN